MLNRFEVSMIYWSWVKVTENHHENRMHGIHFGSKHPLHQLLALFSSSRTRPIYLQHVIFRARTNSLQFWNTGKNSGHDGIHVQLYPNLEKKSGDARGRTLWLTICSALEFRELH
jgi:hypothetical protein